MNIYETKTMGARIAGNSYVGRGIVLGPPPDGRQAVAAYFIMGRSANSRNRVFTRRDGCVFTEPYDASKVEDPSLIIYAAVRELPESSSSPTATRRIPFMPGCKWEKRSPKAWKAGALSRMPPNLTPRISGLVSFTGESFRYDLSILKSIDPEGSAAPGSPFCLSAKAGLGHFIHTYVQNGTPSLLSRGAGAGLHSQ